MFYYDLFYQDTRFIVIVIYKMLIDGNLKLTSNRKASPDSFRLRIQHCRRSFLPFNECSLTLPCSDFLWWAIFFERGVALELPDVRRSKWPNLSFSFLIFGSNVCSFIDSSSFTFGRISVSSYKISIYFISRYRQYYRYVWYILIINNIYGINSPYIPYLNLG